MSGTSPCRVLDMSWTCPLSWVFRSNLEYPPSPGYRSGTRRMIQVLICYPTVPGVLEGTWTMSDILGKSCGYGAQLHLKPHPRHGHISPRFFRPKCQVGVYTISWVMGCGPGRMIQQVGICYPNAVWVFDGVYDMFDRYGESKGA